MLNRGYQSQKLIWIGLVRGGKDSTKNMSKDFWEPMEYVIKIISTTLTTFFKDLASLMTTRESIAHNLTASIIRQVLSKHITLAPSVKYITGSKDLVERGDMKEFLARECGKEVCYDTLRQLIHQHLLY